MKNATLVACKAILDSDPVRTRADRETLLRALGIDGPAPDKPAEKIVSCEEAARRLNRTERSVHYLARRGIIRKAKLPGSTRASGVLASDLEKLLQAAVAGEGEGRELEVRS